MSDIVTGRIGARIRECRLAAGMTQEELAGDIITRNMLSMIESGKSTPSLETLSEICARLGVSVSRIFADEREDAIFRKGKIIDSFRALFREKRYSELADEAERVQVFDEEILTLLAYSYIGIAAELLVQCKPMTAKVYFDKALDASENTSARAYAENTMRFANLLYESATNRNISPELCEQMNFSPSAVPPEFFAYLSALRFSETGENEYAEAIERSGLVSSEQYLLHLRGGAMYSAGNLESALALFIKAADSEPKGFFSLLRIYTDIELCAQRIGNYEIAYKYSAKHIALVENFGK